MLTRTAQFEVCGGLGSGVEERECVDKRRGRERERREGRRMVAAMIVYSSARVG